MQLEKPIQKNEVVIHENIQPVSHLQYHLEIEIVASLLGVE